MIRGAALACALASVALAAAPARGEAGDLAAQARSIVGADQGVHVETEAGEVWVSQAADRPVHPASVSKIPTTLALLRTLGPRHRFVTRFSGTGPLRSGVLDGDLVVEGSGDPFFVDENALLVLRALRERGVREVRGDLVLHGPLVFDWKEQRAADPLRSVLEGGAPPAAWAAVRRAGDPSGAPGLVFRRAREASDGSAETLVVHRSQPLVPQVKALNGYSNNVFAPFADAVGGIVRVEEIARASVPGEMRDEIVLGDGAGASPRNRLSPRAAVALLRALQAELGKHGRTLADVLPVAGVDEGTLRTRLADDGERGLVTGKTGTYGDYGASALAGAVRTRSHGVVYFAVLDHGVPVEEARRRQDAFVRALLARVDAEPWPYALDDAPAFTRAEVVAELGADQASGVGGETAAGR